MCGRYTVAADPELLAERFDIRMPDGWEPRFNVAPTQPVLGVVVREGVRQPRMLTWGLVPGFSKDARGGGRMINARAETLEARPVYRRLLDHRRCLVIADGFYEWRRDADGVRRPVRFTLDDGAPFAFAGLWASWRASREDEWLHSCTIVTTEANPLVAHAHDRMPVILPRDREEAWLAAPVEEALGLVVPYTGPMAASDASLLVNAPANEGPELLDPLAGRDAEPAQPTLPLDEG